MEEFKIIKYPDNSSYVKIPGFASEYKTCKKIFRINSYEDLWHLNQFTEVFYYLNSFKPTVVIPWLIDGQADRRFNENESSGLKLVCNFLNKMPANFEIFHPHNFEVIEALMDNVKIIDNKRFISEVLWKIKKEDKDKYPAIIDDSFNGPEGYYRDSRLDNNLILMSSDAGGFKPLMKLCNQLQWQGETYSASKARQQLMGETSLVHHIDKQDFEGKDILIIDDLCVYGGTFKNLSKLLKKRNCGKLYLAVSHMTVQDLGVDSVTDYFDKVFTTNSKYDNYYTGKVLTQPQNLEIIKIF